MKTTLLLLSCAVPFCLISCGGGQPAEVHNITIVQPKPKPKKKPAPRRKVRLDRPEDFRATTTPN